MRNASLAYGGDHENALASIFCLGLLGTRLPTGLQKFELAHRDNATVIKRKRQDL